MTFLGAASGISKTRPGAQAHDWSIVARAELRLWAIVAISSLGIAGVFALMLALSRMPGVATVVPWPLDFFAKGLVIHVVFSLVVWFLAVFSLLVSLATFELADGHEPRFAVLGRAGAWLAVYAFPMLFVPAFLNGSEASLNNYVPVIIHPFYYCGLVTLALGILFPVVRLFVNLRTVALKDLGILPFAMAAGGVLYVVALICFGSALAQMWGALPSRSFHEQLFWGGGHVLQFLNALMMLTGWVLLLKVSLGPSAIDARLFRIAISLLVVFILPAPIIYQLFDPYSMVQSEAFRRLQFVLGLPTLLLAFSGLGAVVAARASRALPWGNPGFVALVLSVLVFGAGGLMGLMISGSDTRTPAHYHGVIAAVNLSIMGVLVCYVLPRFGRPVHAGKFVKRQFLMFGIGQFIACVGLFMAGGYGAARKMTAEGVSMFDATVVGLYLNGIGAVLAVVGGVLFVTTLGFALARRDRQIASSWPSCADRESIKKT